MERRSFNKLAALAGIGAFVPGGASAEETRKNPWREYMLGSSYYPEWWEPSESGHRLNVGLCGRNLWGADWSEFDT
jgi:hypothetical protein